MIYISNYAGAEDNTDNRINSPAGDNVARYMIDTLLGINPDTSFVSTAGVSSPRGSFPHRYGHVEEARIYFFSTFGAKGKGARAFRSILRKAQLLLYLLRNTRRHDTVIYYHSCATIGIVTLAKRIKKFSLIIQTEELYSDVVPQIDAGTELRYLRKGDAYILPTLELSSMVDNKPFIIKHGAYTIPKKCGKPFDDGKIHVVYAGTFDPTKGGCQAAAAAQYLDARFHVHILGFGTETETENIKTIVEKVKKETQCVLTYDGLLQGEAFVEFLQSCDIGLSTQNPDAAYNDTSFPSKVLTYLSNGLKVVTIRIKALETSKVGDLLYYYDTQTPQSIADAIRLAASADDRQNGLDRLAALDAEFGKELGQLIQTVSRMKKR